LFNKTIPEAFQILTNLIGQIGALGCGPNRGRGVREWLPAVGWAGRKRKPGRVDSVIWALIFWYFFIKKKVRKRLN